MAAAVEAFNIARQVEMAAQYANNEMKRHLGVSASLRVQIQYGLRLRSDHDQAISNLAENMGRHAAQNRVSAASHME